MPAERILIIGGSGSGKTTLAAQLAEKNGLPVHHLDEIARVGGGRGAETSAEDRAAATDAIVASGRWIAEGVHIGWTTPLAEAADAIVWLDHVAPTRSGGRVVRRFMAQALSEARRQRGWRRFLRVRDYGRRLRELAVSLPDTHTFPRDDVERAMAPYSAKLLRCRTPADLASAVESVLSGGRRG